MFKAIEELIKQEIAREELKGLDAVGSEKPAAKGKPRRRKTDAEAESTHLQAAMEGRRRGLLGRNRRKTRTGRLKQNRLLKKLKKPKNLQNRKKRNAHRAKPQR